MMLLRVFAGLLVTAMAVVAVEEEQWLQYRWARDSRRIIRDMGREVLDMTEDKPAGVELPELVGATPLFGFWRTPMVSAGRLWIAVDNSKKYGPYDRLYIDSDGDGDLKDETAAEPYRTDNNRSSFGPVKVILEGEDGPITYHLNFDVYTRRGGRQLYVTSGGWYDGTITVGGAKKQCVIIDRNANGTFDDKSEHREQSDRIRIGKDVKRDTRFVGNYVQVDGVLYELEIARDGAYVKLSKADDVKYGKIVLPKTISELAVGGENGLLYAELENGAARLPAGKYVVDHWAIDREDKDGVKWTLKGQNYGTNSNAFEVAAGAVVSLSVGEPIISTLEVQHKQNNYSFRQNLTGQLGERIEILRRGRRARAPKLHVRNGDCKYDRKFNFEYG